jgi:hypothetical protein
MLVAAKSAATVLPKSVIDCGTLPLERVEYTTGLREAVCGLEGRLPDAADWYPSDQRFCIQENVWLRAQAREEGREEGREMGREEGEIRLIQTLQEILGVPVSDVSVFHGQSLEQLRAMTDELRSKIQRRS